MHSSPHLICRNIILLQMLLGLTLSHWIQSGKSYSFTCVANNNGFSLHWEFGNEIKSDTLFKCEEKANKCDHFDSDVLNHFSANFTSNSTILMSVLTIQFVTPLHHNKRLLCIEDTNGEQLKLIAQYNVNVYALAKSPICNSVKIQNESFLKINCFTQEVFPKGICFFETQNQNSTENKTGGTINYTHQLDNTTGFYETNCSYNASAATLGPGSFMFRVVMYPNITSNITESIQTSSPYSTSIKIGIPRAQLQDNCNVHVYIKEKMTGYCSCFDNNTSILPTTVVWTKDNQRYPFNETLEFLAQRNEVYLCTINNSLNWNNTVQFKPNVSYPPVNVILKETYQDLDNCQETTVPFSGTCLVNESNPEPNVYINISNTLTRISTMKNDGVYTFNQSITTGVHYISCLVNSSEYTNIVSQFTEPISIKGPPDIPEIFVYEKGLMKKHSENVVQITMDDIIACRSEGGYPLFKNVSLACGNESKNAKNENEVRLTLNMSSSQSLTCECSVWHESKCQRNKTTMLFTYILPEKPQSTGQNFDNIYIGVGVVAGCVLITICIIFMVSHYRIHHLDKILSETTEKIVSNDDLYFIKQEKSSIDISIYPEYTNVFTTMASAMEAPKNLKK